MGKQNFIYTSDKETADKLIALGFDQLQNQGNFYVFLNSSKDIQSAFNRNDIDRTKLITGNKLIM